MIVAISFGARSVCAQTSNDGPRLAEARAAFIEGMSLIKEEKWVQAQERFNLAIEARRTPGLLYYVAFCLEKQGRFLEALDVYRQSRDLLERAPAADVETLLPEAIVRVSTSLATLSFDGLFPGAQVFIDGTPQKGSGEIKLDPGRHTIRVTAPGHQPYRTTAELSQGERLRIQLAMEPVPVKAPPRAKSEAAPADTSPRTRPTHTAKPFVVGGLAAVGLVGLGAGIYTTIKWHGHGAAFNDVDDEFVAQGGDDSSCTMPSAQWAESCNELESELRKRHRTLPWMIAGYGVFGAATAAAILTELLWTPSPVGVAVHLQGGASLSWTSKF